MNNQETIIQLECLKLKGMSEAYKAILQLPVQDMPSGNLLVAKLVEAEKEYRDRKRTEMYLKTSKLRYNTLLEDVICTTERNFTKEMLLALSDCNFIPSAQNPLIDGKTGCGKSYLACALGRPASWATG